MHAGAKNKVRKKASIMLEAEDLAQGKRSLPSPQVPRPEL